MPCDDLLTAATRACLSVDLLPSWYDDDWVVLEREQFHQLWLHALEAMCERLIVARRYGEAVDAALAVVCTEPLRESAQQALIRAYLAAGNRFDACRQYGGYRRILDDEVGLEPPRALHDLLPAQYRRQAIRRLDAPDRSSRTVSATGRDNGRVRV